MTRVCMCCHRELAADNTPLGLVPTDTEHQTHGICLDCSPDWLRDGGLSEEQIEKIMEGVCKH